MGINYFEEIKKVAPLNTWVELDSPPIIFVNVLISKKIYFTNNYENFYRDNDLSRKCQFNCGVRDLESVRWFKVLYKAITGKEAYRSSSEGNSKLKEELKNHPRILDLALKRLDRGGDHGLATAFTWRKTPEGHAFWTDICHRRYQAFYDKFGGVNPEYRSAEPPIRSKYAEYADSLKEPDGTVADILKDRRDLQELYYLEQDNQDTDRNLDIPYASNKSGGGIHWSLSRCGSGFWRDILEHKHFPSEATVAAAFRNHFTTEHLDRVAKVAEMKEIDPLENIMDSLQVKTLTVF